MSKRIAPILSLLACVAAGAAHAQYASIEQARTAKDTAQAQIADTVRQEYLGRKFWIEPNPNAISHVEFVEKYGRHLGRDNKFVVTSTTSFTVSGFASDEYTRYVEVTFQDGKTAYLAENSIFYLDPRREALFSELYSLKERRYDFKEYILPMSPEDLQAAISKKRKKDAATAAAWKARGGVSIGMTADQVRRSNWGKPQSINRTTGTFGVHEQWVYGDSNYIYLENGRVTAIQN